MTYTVSITSQGQMSIPAKVRRQLGLDAKKKAILSVEKGEIIIRPVQDILDLRGSLKSKKPALTNDQLHDMVGQQMAKDFSRKLK